ncbi:MAG: hypothetical protein LH475_04760 [Cryobacterium sp.]|uniref:hypothetical protein n=1 Tax=Cryobacterium sp. TaxID=1926290 RepID=UPI0022A4D323|nr:hypothetical protein [Cryobacterium sp.]MCY7403930.1 hypothetical protein [Cryobacterium sp.]
MTLRRQDMPRSLIFPLLCFGLRVAPWPTAYVAITVVRADGAEVDDLAEQSIVVDDEVHGDEAFRFGDMYYLARQRIPRLILFCRDLIEPLFETVRTRGPVLPQRRTSGVSSSVK